MSRPSQAVVDLDAIAANYRALRARHGGKAFAVLKANAYGHGAVPVARKLQGLADALAVAFVQEGVALRAAGVQAPILILEGAFDAEEWAQASALGFWMVVHQAEQIAMLEQAADRLQPLQLWLKLETGMQRLGLPCAQARALQARLQRLPCVAQVHFMTHLACADEAHSDATRQQLARFTRATQGLGGDTSVCNSAAVMAWPGSAGTWARLGIALYGASPLPGDDGLALRPAMTLQSRVFAVKSLAAGQALGYGGAFVAPRATRVGMVAVGYADGYPRSASAAPVWVEGQISQTLGRVSMDMLAIDLTDCPGCGLGSAVELWGRHLGVNRVARCAGTIAYELLCNTKRVDFDYLDSVLA